MFPVKFITLDCLVNENDETETSPSIIPITLIKQISKVEKRPDSVIELPTKEIGKCGIKLFDGNMLIVNHSFEEICALLETTAVPMKLIPMEELMKKN